MLTQSPSYLTLRHIPYTRCIVTPILPRPTLTSLGIHYRRIPILSIGRDIYCDSRMIIAKLEQLYPDHRLAATQPFDQAVEYLVENFINDGGPFWRTAQTISPELVSEEFAKDRSEMTGRKFEREGRERDRPEAMGHLRMYFDWMEEKVLGDGREWVLGGKEVDLADVHAAWLFDWAGNLAGLRKEGVVSEERYPGVWKWLERYIGKVEEVRKVDGRMGTVSDEETIEKILGAGFAEEEGKIDEVDPLKLKKGQVVEMWPVDSGMNHHEKGELVSIAANEVVVKSEVPGGKGHLRIHYPRTNFKIVPMQEGSKL